MNRIAEIRAVARVRHGQDFTLDRLSERLGVSRQTLASWEAGKTEPTISQAVALSDALGCTVEELGYGE